MNARQKAKKQKKEIRALKSDNRLMREIIADNPDMQALYNAYTRPALIIHSPMQFQEFRARRMIPSNVTDATGLIPAYITDTKELIGYTKQALATVLFESIKEEYITYEVDTESERPTVTASICVGVK